MMEVAMISENQRATLVDLFTNTERLDNIYIQCDVSSRDVIVTYENCDSQWFVELLEGR